jgi:phosphatidylglycerophosphatase A
MADGIRDSAFGIRPDDVTSNPVPNAARIPNPNRIPNPKSRIPALAIATALGVGYVPFAPGTFGSAAGLILWAVLPATATAQGIAILVLFVAGSWSGSVAERHFGRTDPGQVVVDEVMGMLITLFMNPVGWVGALGAFLLFRVADVVKPYPANRLERLHGGVGVMADDGMAAVYANLALRAVLATGHWVIGLGNWVIG